MDETLVGELESAIADVGALLVRAQKYRRGAGPEGEALARDALAVGDAARRMHRRETLDDAAARTLLGEAHRVGEALRALVDAVRADARYARAVAAHRAGAAAVLAPLLPEIFAGLEPVSPGYLYTAARWLHRARLRPPGDVAAEIAAVGRDGIPGEGDDLSPGADAELPAVVLHATVPPDEPVAVRIGPLSGVPLHRLVHGGEILAHAARVVAPPVTVVAASLADDEQLRVEIRPEEWRRFRAALTAALADAGVPVEAR
jgi:hypothetical protein